MKLTAHFYEQFDADYAQAVPAESFGGWKSCSVTLAPKHTALVLMHAWDCGTGDQYPGWYRTVEYLPRAEKICKIIFPPLLAAARNSSVRVFHVVGGGDYYRNLPGYKKAVKLAGPAPDPPEQITVDPHLEKLQQARRPHGHHNQDDIRRGFENLDFPTEAKPLGEEGIAENTPQLFALCREHGINHLIYAGFALNWCLLLSPGGMADMSRHGIMCSALRQAVTAVENRETAREQLGKQIALWRVALAFGYVFDVDDFIGALDNRRA